MNSELEKAARYLEGTASDYEQMAAQLRSWNHRTQNQEMDLSHYERAASLLRGQALRIRELK